MLTPTFLLQMPLELGVFVCSYKVIFHTTVGYSIKISCMLVLSCLHVGRVDSTFKLNVE